MSVSANFSEIQSINRIEIEGESRGIEAWKVMKCLVAIVGCVAVNTG